MKERPILFSGPMVRAILEGRKTQTRRVVKMTDDGIFLWHAARVGLDIEREDNRKDIANASPFGVRGDRLWVRETWRTGVSLDKHNATQIAESAREAGWTKPWAPLLYTVDDGRDNADTLRSFGGTWGRVRSARFMPRWASRITLAVTSVRVAPLKSITEEDAIAEGCTGTDPEPKNEGGTIFHWEGVSSRPSPIAHFAHLWDSLNGSRASWASNPWVWVVGFERVLEERRAA